MSTWKKSDYADKTWGKDRRELKKRAGRVRRCLMADFGNGK
jgi:hypothetical protein